MGTRAWTLSTLLGCCAWILHGLGAVTAVPVTTDGSFTVGTAFPMTTEDEWPQTTERSATAADAETFPPWTEMDPVMATSEYSPSVPALGNETKALNMTQSNEGRSAAPNMATTAAAITAQHPAVTPEVVQDEPEVPPDVPLGTTPVLEDVKEGITTDPSPGTASLHSTPPLAVTWVPQPTAGVTVLPSQGVSTAQGAVQEGEILPEDIQSEASASSLGSSPGAGELLPAQQDGAVGGDEGINPEPAGETAPAGEESPLPSESGDAIKGELSTASSSHLPAESPVLSGTVESPGKSSLLPGPVTSLAPSDGGDGDGDGDGDGQGVPGMPSDAPGSASPPAASRAPAAPEETEDAATSVPAPGAPTEAQSDTNLPVSAAALPAGDVGAVDLPSPSLQPAPWQTPTGEQPLLLPDALTPPTDTPSAPGDAHPAPEAGASALPDADAAAQTPASPDLAVAPEVAVSPSPGESQPAGAPQDADGLGTGLSSDSGTPSSAPSVPDGLAWPSAGIQGQGAEGTGDMALAEGSGDASPHEDTQSDTSPPALQPSGSPADNGELLTGGSEDLANAEHSPPSALGDGTETATGGAPARGQVSSSSSAPPSNAGMESDLSGPEGPGDLPSESASAPGAVSPALGSVAGPVSEAETPVSPDLSAAQGAPGSPSFGGSEPRGAAAGAPGAAGLPGVQGPDTDSTSAWGTPSSAAHEPVGPPSPGLGDQPGTDVELPAAEVQGASVAEPAVEGAGSGIESEPSLSSTAGSGAAAAGMDQVPSAGSPTGITSPNDVAAPSVSRGDEAEPISSAAPGPDSLSPASPEGETGPGLGLVQGAESAGDVAQAENPESENPNMETSPSAVGPQQDLTNTGELPAEETGNVVPAELSPPSALGDGTETATGGAPALGQVSSSSSAPPSNAGMESDLSGPEGPGDLPSESASAPGAVSPALGSVAGPVSEAETPVSPDLSAAQGAPGSPSFGGSEPRGAAAGAPGAAGLPGVQGPDTDSTSAWGTPSSAAHEPVGPPSPGLGDQPGTNVGLPAAEGQGASVAEPAVEGAGSGIESEPSLSSTAGSGAAAAGVDQVPSAGSPTGITSPNDVAAPSVSRGDEAEPISSAAPGPDSLSPASPEGETGPGLGLVQGAESAGDVAQAGNPESGNPNMETSPSAVSPQQGEVPGADSSPGSASPSGDVAASSVSDPSSLGALGDTDSAAGGVQPALGAGTGVLPAAGEGASEGAGVVGSTGQSQAPPGMGPAGSESLDGETGGVLQSASSSSSTEGSSSPGRTGEAADEKGLPGATAAGAGLNTGLGAAGPQEASVSAPGSQSGANTELSNGKLSEVDVVEVPGGASVNGGPSPGASLVPVAPDNSGVSSGMITSVPGSVPLPGQGLSSGLAPNSAPSTQSGGSPLLPGSPGGLPEAAGGAQSWSLEDEVASGMPAPLGEASPRAPTSPNAAPAPPSAPQRGNSAEEVSASPGPLARESIVGSSAGGEGELGAAAPGGAALLLPPQQLGSPGAPSGDADSPAPGEGSAVLQGTGTGQGDVTHLLPGAQMEAHSPPGLPGLPPSGITAGSPGAQTLGPGPAGGSSPTALQPPLGRELTTSLANRAPAATPGSSFAGGSPGRGGSQGGSPGTSCSLAPAPAAPLPRGKAVLPRPGAATATSRASSPVVPAPPGVPAAAPTLLPSPTAPAVPLYAYGARENDQEYVERKVDFNSPLFKPETGFPFGRTLRSSLYFTDNGQIIFPASDNNVLTYPSPPASGFNGHEEVPMIAVFWDNADFSRGVGTTFYQEFSTLNTAKPPFVRDVEAKVRRYLRSSYSAAWTLKITWEKAPVHAARTDTRKTITYQAVLTTDGFRSYILMLYQDGGMQWDYTRLPSTNVLIGYTSGDGFYHNDDLTKRPPAAKYRPDQFRGYNTDLRGLWIYKLESRVGTNYRLKCLAWTGQQQEPRAWSQGLPTCPCSLQQGQQDPRFKSSRGGRWGARVSMLHSASPNQHGAGVRCLYDSQDQLIEGRQERYWRNSRQASPYRDQELKLYDWCCNRAGSAHLCARYSEKRPKIGCDGYQSPSTDSSEEAENDSDEQIDGEDK